MLEPGNGPAIRDFPAQILCERGGAFNVRGLAMSRESRGRGIEHEREREPREVRRAAGFWQDSRTMSPETAGNPSEVALSGADGRHSQRPRRRWGCAAALLVLFAAFGGWGALEFRLYQRFGCPPAMETPNMPDLQAAHVTTWHRWYLKPNLTEFEVRTHHVATLLTPIPRVFRFSTNGLGLRGGPILPDGGRLRILALGDSTTFGLGVNDEETWPACLEMLLNGHAGAARFEVVNAGVTGYTVVQGCQAWVGRWQALRPAVIIATFGNNDWEVWDGVSDSERLAWYAPLEPGVGRPRVLAYVQLLYRQWARKRAIEGDPRNKKPRVPAEEFRETVARLDAFAAERGAGLICVLWPWREQYAAHDPAPVHYQQDLIDVCASLRIPLVDLRTVLLGAPEDPFIDMVHVNPEGCRLVAEAVAAAVEATLVGQP